jgi:RNA polymerase sigma-70 factor (ECF subfamily)
VPAVTDETDAPDASFEATLAEARRGSGRAFEALYHENARHLQAFLRARRADDPSAVTNEAFRRAFDGLARFEGHSQGQFRAWVFAIARNLLIDEQRQRARRPELVLLAEPAERAGPEDVEAQVMAGLDEDSARALLDELPPDQREVLLLRIIGELTTEEVGDLLGKRPGAVRALQMRGLRRLRRLLAERDVRPNP